MTVAIVDYGAGNLRSVAKAFEQVSRRSGSDRPVIITSDPDKVYKADWIVLPGDGAFADCRRGLDQTDGMIQSLREVVETKARPFLGICIGMQLLATTGREHGVTEGLGWIPGEVIQLRPANPGLKVPHMGWNTLDPQLDHPLLEDLDLGPQGLHAYFLHGFHLVPKDGADVLAAADYGGPVTAMVARGTVAGAQFHPEKSQKLGLKILENFLRWRP
ncbi:imidazole glycerol phosphate synthase subunit HisH [Agaricicola taiwanensis]|uniref:Imidazole glycerol phosphate synthase subunit HisH n=1 Tax=Agaricicola taiwanensis TaxID=591372 RepID=A0A8J2YBU5_9RHOB|nr:imidazole glycerol phosphate synthase subunit HisH [Agaricicola taiwanensis]GGE28941.1 imidazole glycerol phosphate synthase subunit HisH [Agaricicola taiwanensis]